EAHAQVPEAAALARGGGDRRADRLLLGQLERLRAEARERTRGGVEPRARALAPVAEPERLDALVARVSRRCAGAVALRQDDQVRAFGAGRGQLLEAGGGLVEDALRTRAERAVQQRPLAREVAPA